MKRKVDEAMHLCSKCAKVSKCDFGFAVYGEQNNVYKCKKFRALNTNKLKPRANKGEFYFVGIFANGDDKSHGFISKKRIENESAIDTLYHENGNYFLIEQECNNHFNIQTK